MCYDGGTRDTELGIIWSGTISPERDTVRVVTHGVIVQHWHMYIHYLRQAGEMWTCLELYYDKVAVPIVGK